MSVFPSFVAAKFLSFPIASSVLPISPKHSEISEFIHSSFLPVSSDFYNILMPLHIFLIFSNKKLFQRISIHHFCQALKIFLNMKVPLHIFQVCLNRNLFRYLSIHHLFQVFYFFQIWKSFFIFSYTVKPISKLAVYRNIIFSLLYSFFIVFNSLLNFK